VVAVEKHNKEHRSMEYVLDENESTTYFYPRGKKRILPDPEIQ
jgi:hypothetical protein